MPAADERVCECKCREGGGWWWWKAGSESLASKDGRTPGRPGGCWRCASGTAGRRRWGGQVGAVEMAAAAGSGGCVHAGARPPLARPPAARVAARSLRRTRWRARGRSRVRIGAGRATAPVSGTPARVSLGACTRVRPLQRTGPVPAHPRLSPCAYSPVRPHPLTRRRIGGVCDGHGHGPSAALGISYFTPPGSAERRRRHHHSMWAPRRQREGPERGGRAHCSGPKMGRRPPRSHSLVRRLLAGKVSMRAAATLGPRPPACRGPAGDPAVLCAG